jgi:predicted lipoprotein with Yx(FWY)xxD motif
MKHHRIASAALLASLASLAFTAPAWSASIEIVTASKAPFGSYLTDGSGRTVYMFTADKKDTSACTGACTTPWPPVLTTGSPTAGTGVQASALGTIQRGSEMQVTYDGMPLYYFIRDKSAGSTAGEGINHFGGSWYVVSPSGKGLLPTGKEMAGAKTW